MPTKPVEGFEEMERALLKLEVKTAGKVLRTSLRNGAKPIADKMKQRVRRKTGALSDSIRVSSSVGSGKRGKFSARARILIGGKGTKKRKAVDYAGLEEFGGSGNRQAHPFARPVFDEEVDNFISDQADAFWEGVKKAVGGNGK